MSFIPEEQAAELVENGLRTVIDLRSRSEAEVTGRGPLERFNVEYVPLPLSLSIEVPDAGVDTQIVGSSPAELGAAYAQLAHSMAPAIVEGIRAVNASEGATLFHCAAGKDRTGVSAAFVLGLAGVGHDEIAADYVKTAANVGRVMDRLVPLFTALVPPEHRGSVLPPADSALMGVPQDTIVSMLQEIDDAFGSMEQLLRVHGGLEQADVEALRQKLIVG